MKLPKSESEIAEQNKAFDVALKKALAKRDEQLKQMMQQDEEIRRIKKSKSKEIKNTLNWFISIPIIIGVITSIFTYYRFGWDFLEGSLLSWAIGATMVTTILAFLEKRLQKI